MITESPLNERIITVPEMAKHLKIGRSTAFNLVRLKKIPVIRIGKLIRIKWSDYQKFLDDRIEG